MARGVRLEVTDRRRGWIPVLALLAACAPTGAAADPLRLEHAGRERLALVHTPGGRPLAPGDAPRAVVLAFHGGGGNAEQFREYAGLDAVADREDFVVVYPEGASRPGWISGRFHVWNSGRCCGYAHAEDVDDVGFVLALLDQLAADLPVDPGRVYATGHSNGAMMAYRLAAEASERVAAIAPVGGAMLLDAFAPAHPVPVLHVHSVDDPRALYAGGEGPPFPFTNHRVSHESVEGQLRRWAERNGCGAQMRIVETRAAPAERADAGHTAERLSFAPCATGADVELWRLSGPGHPWPGVASLAFRRGWMWARAVGPPSAVIDAAEEAWRFFARFERDAEQTGPPGSGRRRTAE